MSLMAEYDDQYPKPKTSVYLGSGSNIYITPKELTSEDIRKRYIPTYWGTTTVPDTGKTVGEEVPAGTDFDPVSKPEHYNSHPSGIEAIEVTENYMTNLGNPIKYLWRLGQKDATAQELGKTRWYVLREISWLKRFQSERKYKVSHVSNRGLVLGLVERYLACEPEGQLKEVKELIMLAPFNTSSIVPLKQAVCLLDHLIEDANAKGTDK